MAQNWIHILVILVFYQKITSGAGETKQVKDGNPADIKCKPELGTMVIWFRVLDNSGMEFIASFTNAVMLKSSTSTSFTSTYSDSKMSSHTLTVKSFNKATDSGVYSCASLVNGRELKFGQATRLAAEKKVEQLTTQTPAEQNLCTTAPACVCDSTGNKIGKKGENTLGGDTKLSMFCTPIILGPLVGGCGLLLLLLIITILYCNKIRTRRCPHHYKRKPRTTAGGKQMQPGRHV